MYVGAATASNLLVSLLLSLLFQLLLLLLLLPLYVLLLAQKSSDVDCGLPAAGVAYTAAAL